MVVECNQGVPYKRDCDKEPGIIIIITNLKLCNVGVVYY